MLVGFTCLELSHFMRYFINLPKIPYFGSLILSGLVLVGWLPGVLNSVCVMQDVTALGVIQNVNYAAVPTIVDMRKVSVYAGEVRSPCKNGDTQ